MTNKDNNTLPSIEELKEVTKKLNDVEIEIPSMIFTYRSYYAMPDFIEPEEAKDNLANVIDNLALLYNNGLLFLMIGKYERYLAWLVESDYRDFVDADRKIIKQTFKIIKYNKLAHKLYEKDILYVYDTLWWW